MKGACLFLMSILAGWPVLGVGALMEAPAYAFVPARSTTTSLGPASGKLQLNTGAEQWITVASNPTFRLRLAAEELHVSGHWLTEDFADRQEVLILREPFASGTTRRNLTPETKSVLQTALGYRVGEEPRGLTGSWFDPASAGQGISLHFNSRDQFVVYFFGFADSGERLWMIGVNDDEFRMGNEVSINLLEATGGRFTDFDPSRVRELIWARLDITFQDCRSAIARLDGMDGFQEMNLYHLAGVEGLACF